MTGPAPDVGELVAALVERSRSLGLTWGLRPAVVRNITGSITKATYDGDTTAIRVTSLIGTLYVGQRVTVMFVPPAGNYVIGVVEGATARGEHVARWYATSTQTLNNGVMTPVAWQDPTVDTLNAYDAGNPTRYTARQRGTYTYNGGPSFAANGTGTRACRWALNGAEQTGTEAGCVPLTGRSTCAVARQFSAYMDVGDYVELKVEHTVSGGGTLDTNASGQQTSVLEVHYHAG